MTAKIQELKHEIAEVIIGQEKMIDALLIGLFCDGHILLEGVPGLAKTTAIKALSSTLGLSQHRVQFTPDLLPSDIIGAEIYDPKEGDFKIKKGPIFTHLLLSDEINRAPAKVQSALLEAMQERQVTIGDETYPLPSPFLTLATQNPVESEGAYNLPEAQLDRFMLKIVVSYNTKEEELLIAQKVSSGDTQSLKQILSAQDLEQIKREIKTVHCDPELEAYMIDLIFATRYPAEHQLEHLKEYIEFGASPRGSIDLFKAVKAHAYLRGNDFVTPVDIAAIIKDVLRHRIIISYEAEAEGITTDYLIEQILATIPQP
jgi:MoxR-like ATPase